MQFDIILAREIYKKIYELERKEDSHICEKNEAILFTKALYMQLYGEEISFCADKDFFVNQTPNGYAVTGYLTHKNGDKLPFHITVNKLDNKWSPSTNYISPDTKSVSGIVWLWLLLMVGCSLFGLISYLILKASIGF